MECLQTPASRPASCARPPNSWRALIWNSGRWFRRIEHADVGEHRYAGHPWRMDGLLERSDLPPPRLGEHSRELLAERLGLSDAEIDDLFDRGVTGAVLN